MKLDHMFKTFYFYIRKLKSRKFPGGPVVKNLPHNAKDRDAVPCLGRSHIPQTEQLSHHN